MTALNATITHPIAAQASDHPNLGLLSRDTCEIHLMADRTATLSGGSTHKVYREWRFEVVLRDGQFPDGRTLFVAPVDSARWAASRSRYAMAQHADQGAIAVDGTSRFSWAATTIGTTDPFATAHDQARQWLVGAGWDQDATRPTHYVKPAARDLIGLDAWEEEGGNSLSEHVFSAP